MGIEPEIHWCESMILGSKVQSFGSTKKKVSLSNFFFFKFGSVGFLAVFEKCLLDP